MNPHPFSFGQSEMDDNLLLEEARVPEAQVQSQRSLELVAKWRGKEINLGSIPDG